MIHFPQYLAQFLQLFFHVDQLIRHFAVSHHMRPNCSSSFRGTTIRVVCTLHRVVRAH